MKSQLESMVGTAEIHKMLVVSTAHINLATSKLINRRAAGIPIIYDKWQYGWFIVVPNIDDAQCPKCLSDIMAYARSIKCDWVMLDQDGDENDNLPVYDWDS